ncbi:hypothetical protein BJV85_003075 [Clostridium acetobutylicum]|uniref:DUF2292 domain-containing protein n=1 Tax=Clostridium acetobutylicum (strain ATCC 824 / DSM 792 / JCM 1419 / IAM 19013 / LMG 5710 / NBRC 13948 / NRRL B-527 / VKM B-1787 / 2291 / W) TaxID=272562 RepID=Q97KI7_CLOAB|nr:MULTISPECIES: YezD family protein [Clostridium]AAK78908.1 Hypothetical protein CA_C0932 [Clostridium acetobutylicum ATCC 824]ADZ19983.1 Conserved hypothetical protein [Clostridium acetobutylicum EA 2018]AEI31511.1 hypothetical protein SMB_G0949 [Clostridium acetobutylicum DSM 1731]AWV80627.1 DUF2292 domain-containing protein [Clostridium acetobutylicum]KHD35945.1 hypothetical protein NL50_11775 [Clostridium acetobutylicum]
MNDLDYKINKSKTIKGERYEEKISKLLKEIKYGSITLIIQDGVVIQIEASQKIRLR